MPISTLELSLTRGASAGLYVIPVGETPPPMSVYHDGFELDCATPWVLQANLHMIEGFLPLHPIVLLNFLVSLEVHASLMPMCGS
jgi:hypothetical protein